MGVRISDNLNYRTNFGGLISIVVILLVIFISLGSLLTFYLGDDAYKETSLSRNLPITNTDPLEMSETEAIVAFQFVNIT